MHESALQQTIALAVFVASYVGLGLGRLPVFRVDRTGVAIIGGALMVLTGVLPWNDAVLAGAGDRGERGKRGHAHQESPEHATSPRSAIGPSRRRNPR